MSVPAIAQPILPGTDLTELSDADLARLFAFAKVAKEDFDKQVEAVRREAEHRVLRQYQESAGQTKDARITLPDGTVVGTLTVRDTSASAKVSDRMLLEEWVEENYPAALVRTVQIDPAFEKYLLSELVVFVDGPDGEKVPVAEGGEVVPGVEYVPAPAPSVVALTFAAAKKNAKVRTETSDLNGRDQVRRFAAEHAPADLIVASDAALEQVPAS